MRSICGRMLAQLARTCGEDDRGRLRADALPAYAPRMSAPSPIPTDPWSGLGSALCAQAGRVREQLIEQAWRHAPGLAVRISSGEAGVIERLGRTRFDLHASEGRIRGAVQARLPFLPFADQSLALVVLDSVGAVLGADMPALIDETARVLANDGRLLVIDQSPWSWMCWRRRWQREPLAPAGMQIAAMLRQLHFVDVQINHALRWLPAPRWVLERWSDALDRCGERLWPAFGGLYAVGGKRHGNNVIAIPLSRAGARTGQLAAPEGMRRAG